MKWKDRIKRARESGSFTNQDIKLANAWVTCACGEQDPRIPVEPVMGPEDTVLNEMGHDFTYCVDHDDFDGAEDVLNLIELRADMILRNLTRSEHVNTVVDTQNS